MTELWQLYDEDGQPLVGQGATKDDTFKQGLLHGAAHVWVWRRTPGGIEVLLQKRSANKRTWPNLYDISAAGHIDLGEDPIVAAVREAQEEIGLTIEPTHLATIARHRIRNTAPSGDIEHEFRWIYLYELQQNTKLQLQTSEVARVDWRPLDDFRQELGDHPDWYVPQGDEYYTTLLAALEKL